MRSRPESRMSSYLQFLNSSKIIKAIRLGPQISSTSLRFRGLVENRLPFFTLRFPFFYILGSHLGLQRTLSYFEVVGTNYVAYLIVFAIQLECIEVLCATSADMFGQNSGVWYGLHTCTSQFLACSTTNIASWYVESFFYGMLC